MAIVAVVRVSPLDHLSPHSGYFFDWLRVHSVHLHPIKRSRALEKDKGGAPHHKKGVNVLV